MAHGFTRFAWDFSLASAALLVASGCSGGGDAQGNPGADAKPSLATDLEACDALSAETVKQLGFSGGDAVKLVDPETPGCQWSGSNAAAGADAEVLLWVLEPGSHDDSVGTVSISGVEVSIWQIDTYNDKTGRYVVPCGDDELVLSYHQNHGPLGAEAALAAVTADAIEAYGCAS